MSACLSVLLEDTLKNPIYELWLREREREKECVFVCVCEKELKFKAMWERKNIFICDGRVRVCERKRVVCVSGVCALERKREWMSVCVCVREKEKVSVYVRNRESECV